MTRKKFIKQLMARGCPRNVADKLARKLGACYIPYGAVRITKVIRKRDCYGRLTNNYTVELMANYGFWCQLKECDTQ